VKESQQRILNIVVENEGRGRDPVIEESVEQVPANEEEEIPIIQEHPQLRRSGRVIQRPSRYLLYGESFQAISIEEEEDPTTYKEAVDDIDTDRWKSAMDSKMKYVYTNSIWELVDLHNGVKPIGCRWFYKRKR
jgi:hypothetical protein